MASTQCPFCRSIVEVIRDNEVQTIWGTYELLNECPVCRSKWFTGNHPEQNRCPECKSTDVTELFFTVEDTGIVERGLSCECGNEWAEKYRFCGIKNGL